MPEDAGGAPVLAVEGLVKRFGAVTAVDDVSFSVRSGETLGLIGPNGSGKSTLFNGILGQLRPDAGRVLLEGRDVTGWPPVRLARAGLGRTFQLLQVFGGMSVRDNLLLAAQEHVGTLVSRLVRAPDLGLSDEVEAALARFRLGPVADLPAGALSYGQQKLLDIAMALMSGPRVVLLDEPAGGVSLAMLDAVADALSSLNRERGTTLVIIEHNMEFVMGLSHRVIVMAEGRIIAEGAPQEVRRHARVIQAYLGG